MKPIFLSILGLLFPLQLFAQVAGSDSSYQNAPQNFDLANIISKRAGATIHSCSSTDSMSFWVANIITDQMGIEGVWRTRPNRTQKFPHWVIIELPEPKLITTFAFNTAATSEETQEGITGRVVTIEFSTQSPTSGYKQVAHEFLSRKKDHQIFHVEALEARWIKINIESNWGHANMTELGRVYAYNDVSTNEYASILAMEGKLDIHGIHFEFNSAEVLHESIPLVETVAQVLHLNHTWKLEVEGHTDSQGNLQANMKLSKERAASVMKLLIDAGIAPERLSYRGYGPTKPLSKEDTEEGMAQNRRVTFKLMN